MKKKHKKINWKEFRVVEKYMYIHYAINIVCCFAFIEKKKCDHIVDMTNKFVDYTCNSQHQCNHNLNFYQLLCQDGKYWANSHRFDLSTILFVFFTNNYSGSRFVQSIQQNS